MILPIPARTTQFQPKSAGTARNWVQNVSRAHSAPNFAKSGAFQSERNGIDIHDNYMYAPWEKKDNDMKQVEKMQNIL